MNNKYLKAFLFGCIGVTTEVFYTAISDYVQPGIGTQRSLELRGHSFIWMFPIYALIPSIYSLLKYRIPQKPLLLRLLVMGIIIILVEFVSGAILDFTIGHCPWDYTGKSRFQLMGYTRFDYLPLWMGFAYICEKILINMVDWAKSVGT